jgi:hypothetical protein
VVGSLFVKIQEPLTHSRQLLVVPQLELRLPLNCIGAPNALPAKANTNAKTNSSLFIIPLS